MEEEAPGRLHAGVGVSAEALVGEAPHLGEGLVLAAARQHQVEALAVERQEVALGLGIDRRLLGLIQETGAFAEEVALGEESDCHYARRLLHQGAASAALDQEDRVAGLALEEDHLAGVHRDPAQAPRNCAQGGVAQAEEHRCPLEHAEARNHVVERDRRAVGLFLRYSLVGGEDRPPNLRRVEGVGAQPHTTP